MSNVRAEAARNLNDATDKVDRSFDVFCWERLLLGMEAALAR
jgi:hypothetical protein